MWMLTPSELRKSAAGFACSLDVGAGSAEAAPGRSTGTPTTPTASADATNREARPARRFADDREAERRDVGVLDAGEPDAGEFGQDLALKARDIDTAGEPLRELAGGARSVRSVL